MIYSVKCANWIGVWTLVLMALPAVYRRTSTIRHKDSEPATEDQFVLIVELLDIYNRVVSTGVLVHYLMLSQPQVRSAGWINAVTLTTLVTNKDKESLDLPIDRRT